jgi:hypothetical protein
VKNLHVEDPISIDMSASNVTGRIDVVRFKGCRFLRLSDTEPHATLLPFLFHRGQSVTHPVQNLHFVASVEICQ